MKRGQITMFIIVGIVLLLVVGLGIAAYKYIAYEKPPDERIIEETNTELKPLRDLITDCVEDATESVFTKIGLHGGYYDPAAAGFTALPTMPTESTALEAFPGQLVPYWRYMDTPNDCTACSIASEQPPLYGDNFPAIEAQAEKAIAAEVLTCLNDFAGFEQQYSITEISEPRVSVTFDDNNVYTTMNYVLDVQTTAGSVTTLRDYSATVDIPIKKAYNYAYGIRTVTEQLPFFEGLTLDTITLESVGDPEPIPPPFGDTDVSYNPGPYWILLDVKQRLATRFEDNIGIVQVLGSTDMDFVSSGDAQVDNQYANYYISLDDPAPSAQINFLYLRQWDPYVRVSPGGQIIKPISLPTVISLIAPLKRKEFFYDVSYPVLIQIRSPRAQGDYLFQAALEVNMRGNEELSFTDITPEQDLSFCDPAFATGTTVDVSVTDYEDNPINAEIHYSCLSESCSLGIARGGELSAQLPFCLGGVIRAERVGYKEAAQNLDSTTGEQDVALRMQRFTTVKVIPQEYYIQKEFTGEETEWALTDQPLEIQYPEKLVLVFTPIDDRSAAQAAVFPDERDTVQLTPGRYEVAGVVLQELAQPKVLKGKEVCALGIIGCSTIPDITLGGTQTVDADGTSYTTTSSTMYLGGLQWDEETKFLDVTQAMLDDGEIKVPVVVIYLPHMQDIDDLDVLDMIDDFSTEVSIS